MGMRVSWWIRGRGSEDGGDESFGPGVVRALMIMSTTIHMQRGCERLQLGG